MKPTVYPVVGFAALVGCLPAEVDLPLDLDEDGALLDDPDPENPDVDDDGVMDGDELLAGSDPLDPESYPYLGGWEIGSCRSDIESTGHEVGDIAENFSLVDQNGQNLHLHDFCDKTVLLISGAFW